MGWSEGGMGSCSRVTVSQSASINLVGAVRPGGWGHSRSMVTRFLSCLVHTCTAQVRLRAVYIAVVATWGPFRCISTYRHLTSLPLHLALSRLVVWHCSFFSKVSSFRNMFLLSLRPNFALSSRPPAFIFTLWKQIYFTDFNFVSNNLLTLVGLIEGVDGISNRWI